MTEKEHLEYLIDRKCAELKESELNRKIVMAISDTTLMRLSADLDILNKRLIELKE